MKKPDPGSKACSLGVLADLFDALGGNAAEGFIKQLFPTFQQFTKVMLLILSFSLIRSNSSRMTTMYATTLHSALACWLRVAVRLERRWLRGFIVKQLSFSKLKNQRNELVTVEREQKHASERQRDGRISAHVRRGKCRATEPTGSPVPAASAAYRRSCRVEDCAHRDWASRPTGQWTG